MRSALRLAGWMMAAAALLGGCGGDDPPTKPPTQSGYPDRSTPQNVLAALVMSYEARDSVEYKDLYDSSYVGTSTNLNALPGSQVTTFRYADEAAHIAALARSTTVYSVLLDFGPSSSWTRLPSDDPSHPEWAMIQINTWKVEIYDGYNGGYSGPSTNPTTFAFKPNVAAPADTTWRIVRWTEVGYSF